MGAVLGIRPAMWIRSRRQLGGRLVRVLLPSAQHARLLGLASGSSPSGCAEPTRPPITRMAVSQIQVWFSCPDGRCCRYSIHGRVDGGHAYNARIPPRLRRGARSRGQRAQERVRRGPSVARDLHVPHAERPRTRGTAASWRDCSPTCRRAARPKGCWPGSGPPCGARTRPRRGPAAGRDPGIPGTQQIAGPPHGPGPQGLAWARRHQGPGVLAPASPPRTRRRWSSRRAAGSGSPSAGPATATCA